MIKTVIFDADGVLIRSRCFQEELEKDFGIAADKLLSFFGSTFKKCLVGRADLQEELGKYHRDWGYAGSVPDLLRYWFQSGSHLDARMMRAVRDLRSRDIRCYVGTNQEKYRTEYLKRELGFELLFDGVCSSSELGVRKPDLAFFAQAYAIINADRPVLRSEVMFWDDRPANVAAARNFGFEAHRFEDYENFRAEMERCF